MKFDTEGMYSDFCCEEMDFFSRAGAQKCIVFDPFYKAFEMNKEENRACIFTLKQGEAKSNQDYKILKAGSVLIPINYCPFCAKKIKFIEKNEEDLTWTTTKAHITFESPNK